MPHKTPSLRRLMSHQRYGACFPYDNARDDAGVVVPGVSGATRLTGLLPERGSVQSSSLAFLASARTNAVASKVPSPLARS